MTSSYGQAIAERREFVGYTRQTDLINALDRLLADTPAYQPFSQQWLSRLERDRTGTIIASAHSPKLRALAYALRWTLAELQEATGVDLGVPTTWTMAGQHAGDDVTSSARVRVPVYALAAAGAGVWTEEEAVTYIEVEPEIARRPNRVTFQVDGSSMEPTLEHGDFIHVDLADRDIRDDKVYVVLMLSNGVVVKRARVYEGGVVELVSDNKNHPSVRPDEARIIGRVCAVTPRTRRL